MAMDEMDIYRLDNDEEEYIGEDQEEGDDLEDHVIYHHFYGF